MAMRPRTAGGNNPNPATAKPVFEDFKPTSEWIQDQESDILLIYLPGFIKENLKVSTEGRNIIRVRGERLVTANKWQRFQEDYQLPNNCNLQGTRARFEGGILTITVPKILVPKNTQQESKPTSSAITAQKTTEIPPKVLETIPPKITASKEEDKAKASRESPVRPQPFSSAPPNVTKEPVTQKIQENIPPKITAFQDSPVAPNPISHVPPKSISHASDDKSVVEQKQKADSGASRHQETLSERIVQQGHAAMEAIRRKRIEKQKQETGRIEPQKTGFVHEDEAKHPKKTATSSGTGHFELRNYKNAVKSVTALDEERKLLVNMGASVLVIMALGAYIYHTVKS